LSTSMAENLLQKRLGYHFNDLALLHLALTHRSCGAKNNERLEFLGDSIVNQVVADRLFHKFPESREGELTRLRAMLVKGVTLAELARDLDVGECLRLGPGELKSGGHRRDSILADTFEALIGAIYLDSDYPTCRERLLAFFNVRLEKLDLSAISKDAKTRLQEVLQSRGEPLPNYELVKVAGDDHSQRFTVACFIKSLPENFEGEGSSRRKAEQQAAETALEALETRR